MEKVLWTPRLWGKRFRISWRVVPTRWYMISFLMILLSLSVSPHAQGADPAMAGWVVENEHVKYVVGSNGRNLSFIDKHTGTDYCLREPARAFARIKAGGKEYEATAIDAHSGTVTIEFGDSGATAVLKSEIFRNYFTIEVLSVTGNDIEELQIIAIPLALKGSLEEPFSSCALALNLRNRSPAAHF